MKHLLKKAETIPALVCIGILIFSSFVFSPPIRNTSIEKEEFISYEHHENMVRFGEFLLKKTENALLATKEEIFPQSKYLPNERNSLGVHYPRVFRAKGKTEKERTKDFVMHHCSLAVQKDWEYGYNFAEKNGIQGALLFAIAFSDTGCGKALTTKNNIGNVGNTSDGKRKEYSSMKAGMEAIVYSLNGKYISGIEKIGHLSAGGRNEIGSVYRCRNAPTPYKCYAMSSENWNANVQRALTSMIGEKIDGNFVFRKKKPSLDLSYVEYK